MERHFFGAAGAETTWFGNMLERSPQLMWEAVSNPTVLDFAETVVGPFVQLDNLTLAAFLPMDEENREKARGTASGYHRDRWGRMPNGNYERPLAFNAITYLQDLTDDNGPVRRALQLLPRPIFVLTRCVVSVAASYNSR